MSVVVSKRPAWFGSALAVLAVAVALLVRTDVSTVGGSVLAVAAGVATVAGGRHVGHHGRRSAGLLGTAAGLLVTTVGVAVGVVGVGEPAVIVDVVPGLVGVALVGLALAPLRGDGSRLLHRVGVGLAFFGVLANGAVGDASSGTLLLAGTLCIVAWDLGETAISVGRQLGRAARTWPVEATQATGTAVVGLVAIWASQIAAGVRAPDDSIETLLVLVVAVLVLAAALHD